MSEQATLQSERRMMPLSKLEKNHWNPNIMDDAEFQALRKDVKIGNYDDLLVSPKDVFYSDPTLPHDIDIIVDGAHRFDAAEQEHLNEVKCEIRPIKEAEAKAISYRKNKERGHMDPILEAQLFRSDIEAGLTEEQAAEKYGISRSIIAAKLSLLNRDTTVVAYYRTGGGEFREKAKKEKMREYHEELRDWKAEVKQAKTEEERKSLEEEKPKEPEEKDFATRGTLTPSHLEAMASLPPEEQKTLANRVINNAWTVRNVEDHVREYKAKVAAEAELKAAMEKAVCPNCPICGKKAVGFAYSNIYGVGGDKNKFKCDNWNHPTWDPMKTKAEILAEKEEEKTADEQKTKEQRSQSLQAARENPNYIKRLETPEHLNNLVQPWVLRKVQQLTEITKVRITGKRGNEKVTIDYDPPTGTGYGFGNMDLDFEVGKNRFGFNIEKKDYKRGGEKSRIDMTHMENKGEKSRQQLQDFFDVTILSDKDPWDHVNNPNRGEKTETKKEAKKKKRSSASSSSEINKIFGDVFEETYGSAATESNLQTADTTDNDFSLDHLAKYKLDKQEREIIKYIVSKPEPVLLEEFKQHFREAGYSDEAVEEIVVRLSSEASSRGDILSAYSKEGVWYVEAGPVWYTEQAAYGG